MIWYRTDRNFGSEHIDAPNAFLCAQKNNLEFNLISCFSNISTEKDGLTIFSLLLKKLPYPFFRLFKEHSVLSLKSIMIDNQLHFYIGNMIIMATAKNMI